MGYRSDVVLAVDTKLVGNLLTALSQCQEAFNTLFTYADKDKGKDGSLLFRMQYVKWYDNYKPVQTIEHWLNGVGELEIDGVDDPLDLVRFVRLGEEFGDTEEIGYYDGMGDIYPQQSIVIS